VDGAEAVHLLYNQNNIDNRSQEMIRKQIIFQLGFESKSAGTKTKRQCSWWRHFRRQTVPRSYRCNEKWSIASGLQSRRRNIITRLSINGNCRRWRWTYRRRRGGKKKIQIEL